MVNLFWQISVNLNLQLIITLWDKSVYSENEKSRPTRLILKILEQLPTPVQADACVVCSV